MSIVEGDAGSGMIFVFVELDPAMLCNLMTFFMSVRQVRDFQRGTDATLLRLEGGCGVKDRRGDANQGGDE